MEMLTVHRKLRCEHNFTPVSVLKGAGTQLLSLLFMTFVVEALSSQMRAMPMPVCSLACSGASQGP